MRLAAVGLALALAACRAGDPADPADPAPARAESRADAEPRIADEERARLQALGYVATASRPADPDLSGVVVHDAARVQPGYRLYSADSACRADLIDVHGTLVRRWQGGPCAKWSHAQLLRNGDLLVPGQHPDDMDPYEPSYLLRFRWSGELVFDLPIHAHHDAAPRPDGSLLALVLKEYPDPAVFEGGDIIDNLILPLSSRGRVLEDPISLHRTLKRRREGSCPFRVPVESSPGKAEPLHMNSIQWIPGRPPSVLISTRHQDCVYRIDWKTKGVIWAWGRGELDGPHDATLLPSGNVLVFDNGMVRGWSRVVEVDPRTDTIVWEYRGSEEHPFYTRGRGGSQRLPNGNTLIAESNEGRAFEVTRSGEIVWEFYNPRIVDGYRGAIIRMRHYDKDFIEPLLAAD